MNKKLPIEKDEKKIENALNLIRMGCYVKPAIIASGLNYNTHIDRYKKGKQSLEPYVQYYDAIEQAKYEAEVGHVKNIHESAMSGNVGVSQWWLARTKPNRWGKREKIDVKQDNHQKIEFVPYSAKKQEKKEDKKESKE